jgi:U3 small nucleolar RNA-associated protein 7
VQDIDFCPMEDVLGIGFNTGFESIIIPGAGKSSIDSYENNPFRTKKQLDNWEVSRLLDKIPAKMITLDSAELRRVAAVKKLDADQDKEDVKVENELEDESEEEEEVKEEVVESSEEEEDERLELAPVTLKKKMKGKSRTGHKELRKKQIRLEKVREHKNQLVENKMKNKKKIKKNKDLIVGEEGVKKRSALDRFR